MPKLQTPDGELDAAEVERRFAEAMTAPEPDEPIAPAPQRHAAAAEQDAAAAEQQPAAPDDKPQHGKARKTSAVPPAAGRGKGRGRGRKPTAAAPASPAPAEGAFIQPVAEFLQAATIAGGLIPLPPGALRTRVRLQASLVADHTVGIATAVDAAARHNAVIRRAVEALTQGSAGWVLPAVLAVSPFVAQSAQLWRGELSDELVAAADRFEATVRAHIGQAMGGAGESATA